MTRILLTGFEPFGNLSQNPSQQIVTALASRPSTPELIARVLPTEYVAAGRILRTLIRRHRPATVLSLGVAAERTSIELERVALNLDDTASADNRAAIRTGRKIMTHGPVAYWSTLPLERLCRRLRADGVPVGISNHAGTFLCNHVFYVAAHTVTTEKLDCRYGFIHVPLPSAELTLDQMVIAIATCLKLL